MVVACIASILEAFELAFRHQCPTFVNTYRQAAANLAG